MEARTEKPTDIEAYIAGFPPEVQALLREMRRVIAEAAPMATERISYGIPTFHWKENLVHFAGYKRHIGFYPTGSGMDAFMDRFVGLKTSRGAVRRRCARDPAFALYRPPRPSRPGGGRQATRLRAPGMPAFGPRPRPRLDRGRGLAGSPARGLSLHRAEPRCGSKSEGGAPIRKMTISVKKKSPDRICPGIRRIERQG